MKAGKAICSEGSQEDRDSGSGNHDDGAVLDVQQQVPFLKNRTIVFKGGSEDPYCGIDSLHPCFKRRHEHPHEWENTYSNYQCDEYT